MPYLQIDPAARCAKLTFKGEEAMIAMCRYGDAQIAAKELHINHDTFYKRLRHCRKLMGGVTILQACLLYQEYRATVSTAGLVHLVAAVGAAPNKESTNE